MADHAFRRASYADLEAVPPHLVAEIIGGELVTHPRPAPRHAGAAGELGIELGRPYGRGRGGPGGWIFLPEPELHLGADVVVPDLAAWRRERLPVEPETAYIEVAPDWVCEISSPSTRDYDRGAKRTIYAGAGVGHLWLLDPRAKMLEAFALTGDKWLLLHTFQADDAICAAPFDAVTFPMANLFPFDAPSGADLA